MQPVASTSRAINVPEFSRSNFILPEKYGRYTGDGFVTKPPIQPFRRPGVWYTNTALELANIVYPDGSLKNSSIAQSKLNDETERAAAATKITELQQQLTFVPLAVRPQLQAQINELRQKYFPAQLVEEKSAARHGDVMAEMKDAKVSAGNERAQIIAALRNILSLTPVPAPPPAPSPPVLTPSIIVPGPPPPFPPAAQPAPAPAAQASSPTSSQPPSPAAPAAALASSPAPSPTTAGAPSPTSTTTSIVISKALQDSIKDEADFVRKLRYYVGDPTLQSLDDLVDYVGSATADFKGEDGIYSKDEIIGAAVSLSENLEKKQKQDVRIALAFLKRGSPYDTTYKPDGRFVEMDKIQAHVDRHLDGKTK